MKKAALEIKNHVLIPKHTKLTKKEVIDLFNRYNITIRELPKIYKSDPAISALGAEPGDVIKIERDSPTAGKSAYYRGVVNG